MKKFLVFLAIISLGAALIWGIPWAMQKIAFNKATEANTVQAYYQFVTQNKQAPQCAEAAERAAVFIDKGERLGEWPDFLAALGDTRSARPLPVLVKYLRYPITEIRRAAAASLLKLAEDYPSEIVQTLGDPNQIAQMIEQDSDPRVRLDVRCLLWRVGSADLAEKIPEPSPFAQDGFAAYRSRHAAAAK